jgi:hypothetical protein
VLEILPYNQRILGAKNKNATIAEPKSNSPKMMNPESTRIKDVVKNNLKNRMKLTCFLRRQAVQS